MCQNLQRLNWDITYFAETNVALGKPAYQSTTAHGGHPSR